jgi:hypothetical protein
MSFVAQFVGRCTECDERIEVGDRIRVSGDAYAHVNCDDPAERPEKPTRFQGTSLKEMGF